MSGKKKECPLRFGQQFRLVQPSKQERKIPGSKPYWDQICSELEKNVTRTPWGNSRKLRQLFPHATYDLLAIIFKFSKRYYDKSLRSRKHARARDPDKLARYSYTDSSASEETDDYDDLLVHPPSVKRSKDYMDRSLNPYALFLEKPRRKAVVWRPLNEEDLKGYNPDATLHMRATKQTDKTCQEFCKWLRELEDSEETINEEILEDMFQINFSTDASRAMQVSVKEMPMVPINIATTRNCWDKSLLEMTKKQLVRDVRAERRKPRTVAFGKNLPLHLRFTPPKNHVKEKWLTYPAIPRDVETLEIIWKDITHLQSVQEFAKWLGQHPEVPQPKSLKRVLNKKRQMGSVKEDESMLNTNGVST